MDLVEALKIIKIKCHPNSNPNPLVDEALDTVEKAIQKLELIDSANPSEVLMFIQELLNISETEKHFINLANYDTRLNLIKTKHALIKAQEDEEKNVMYKQLREQLGCPLELIAKLKKANYIYRDDGLEFGFIGINFNDEDKLILYDDDEWNTFTSDLRLSDYNKTWWLREDKRE